MKKKQIEELNYCRNFVVESQDDSDISGQGRLFSASQISWTEARNTQTDGGRESIFFGGRSVEINQESMTLKNTSHYFAP